MKKLFETEHVSERDVLTAQRIAAVSYDRAGQGPESLDPAQWRPLDLTGLNPRGVYEIGPAALVLLVQEGGDAGSTADDTLVIGFRGTDVDDPLADIVTYWRLDPDTLRTAYFETLRPVVEAAFATAKAAGMDVMLTGHSLGGAAVTGTFDWLAGAGAAEYGAMDVRGVTFNSPISGLRPDAPMLEITYANDLLGGIAGQPAPNALDSIWYAVNPASVAPTYDGSDLTGFLSETLQAYTSPAHDIARFEALADLMDSRVYDAVDADDFVVIDRNDHAVSVDAITLLSRDAAAKVAASDVVGVLGSAARDTLFGASRKGDIMDGAGGNDSLYGMGGNDTLIGGAGNDVLSGGSGLDGFLFEGVFGNDRVLDWRSGEALTFVDFGRTITSVAELRDWVEEDPADGITATVGWWSPLTLTVGDAGSVRLDTVHQWEWMMAA